MRLSKTMYESLPIIYFLMGGAALWLSYLVAAGVQATIALFIALAAEVAALTLVLRRQNYRSLKREYSETGSDLPTP